MDINYEEYLITDDKSLISPKAVKALLDKSYWASDRNIDTITKTIEHSICIGVFAENKLVGFGRAVTDKAVFAWIADIIIHEEHRTKGLGKQIMLFIQKHPEIPKSLQILRTKDAHKLYEKYGFSINSEFMSK
ncbi:GNAT family N-acetyltransferase [Sulfurospirillum arcachonense]|uniref:GNAT family N-acetyltransferase n=1 Tax=Sulfurospirillum arcachonense TaxID=57666 RepID=UPI0004BC0E9F|nr:GNAT family N-acetyltransferase [Sulfurospirillum arcachonense]